MKIKTIGAASAVVLALGVGSAFAWEMDPHEAFVSSSPGLAATTQAYQPYGGADLRIPGVVPSWSEGNLLDESRCAEAKASHPPGSFEIVTFCDPGNR